MFVIGILLGLYVITAVVEVMGVVIGAGFSLIGKLLSVVFGSFAWEGVPVGIAIGLVWYVLRRRNAKKAVS